MVTKCRHKVTKDVVAIKKFKDNDDDEQVCGRRTVPALKVPAIPQLGPLSDGVWQQQVARELPAHAGCPVATRAHDTGTVTLRATPTVVDQRERNDRSSVKHLHPRAMQDRSASLAICLPEPSHACSRCKSRIAPKHRFDLGYG